MPKNGEGIPNFTTNPATPSWPPLYDALLERCRYTHRPQPHYFAYMLIKLTCKYFIMNSRGGASGISAMGGRASVPGGWNWMSDTRRRRWARAFKRLYYSKRCGL